MSPAGSTRWCPTPQQLMLLEEMYRSGISTPNATQIRQITSQLSLYVKIEGKNVFYWFQNHKARDRQQLRKKLTRQLQHQQLLHYFDSPTFPHLSYYNSAPPNLLPQAGIHDEAAKQVMNCTWNFDIPGRVDKNKGMMRTYGTSNDWLMMVDMGPPPPTSAAAAACYSMMPRHPLKRFNFSQPLLQISRKSATTTPTPALSPTLPLIQHSS